MRRGIGTRKKKHFGDEEETWDEEKKNQDNKDKNWDDKKIWHNEEIEELG